MWFRNSEYILWHEEFVCYKFFHKNIEFAQVFVIMDKNSLWYLYLLNFRFFIFISFKFYFFKCCYILYFIDDEILVLFQQLYWLIADTTFIFYNFSETRRFVGNSFSACLPKASQEREFFLASNTKGTTLLKLKLRCITF